MAEQRCERGCPHPDPQCAEAGLITVIAGPCFAFLPSLAAFIYPTEPGVEEEAVINTIQAAYCPAVIIKFVFHQRQFMRMFIASVFTVHSVRRRSKWQSRGKIGLLGFWTREHLQFPPLSCAAKYLWQIISRSIRKSPLLVLG